MRTIFLDIETAPSQRADIRDELASTIKPPGTLKKAESIAAWERDEKPAAIEDAYLKTGLDGTWGRIVCIGWAFDDGETDSVCIEDLSEAEEKRTLEEFFTIVHQAHSGSSGQRPVIVGHNHAQFDLPFLWKRSVVNNVKPPFWWPKSPKPWSDAIFDTMTQWAGDRDRISLDRLCRVLGIAGKGDGPTGADVWPMVQAGRFDDIAEYCREDVERTRAIYKRLTFAEAA